MFFCWNMAPGYALESYFGKAKVQPPILYKWENWGFNNLLKII